MANVSHIPEKYFAKVSEWIADRKTADDIQVLLLETYGVSVSTYSVARLCTKLRRERQAIARGILTENIQQSAAEDLETMGKMLKSLERSYWKAVEKDDIALSLKISAELNKWNQRRMELSGISQDEQSQTAAINDDNSEEIKKELMDKLHLVKSKAG